MPDFLPAAEVLAKGVRHVATYVADAIAERRKAFDDDEAGDYLRCAGADALAEADPMARAHATIAGMASKLESIGVFDEPTVCYFCNRPTDRTVVTSADYDTEYVCVRCTDVAQSPAAAIPPLAAAADPAAAEAFPPSMTAAGSSNPFDDCGLFTAGAAFAADLDETLSTVAELDWPDVAAALRILANFLDPK